MAFHEYYMHGEERRGNMTIEQSRTDGGGGGGDWRRNRSRE